MIDKLVIVGVGLIGGSLALALREAGAVKEIVGLGRSRENLETARALGIIDRIETDLASAVKDADVVVLAVPVAAMQPTLAQLSPCLSPHTIVTDVGSTKRDVIAYARQHLPNHLNRFIPGHPIAGAEKSGATAAFADLSRELNFAVPIQYLRTLKPARTNWTSLREKSVRFQASMADAAVTEILVTRDQKSGGEIAASPLRTRSASRPAVVYFKKGREVLCDAAWKEGLTVFLVIHGKGYAVGYKEEEIDMKRSFDL